MEEYINIGKIVNTHALKGLLKANVYTEKLLDIQKYPYIYLSKNGNEYIKYEIVEIKESKNQVILNLKGIEDIDEAEKLKNYNIYIKNSELKEFNPLSENEWYIKDLIGLDVYDEKGNHIGILKEVLELNTDVYVIKTLDKEILIPAIKQYVKTVDIENNKMIVNLGNLDEI